MTIAKRREGKEGERRKEEGKERGERRKVKETVVRLSLSFVNDGSIDAESRTKGT